MKHTAAAKNDDSRDKARQTRQLDAKNLEKENFAQMHPSKNVRTVQ